LQVVSGDNIDLVMFADRFPKPGETIVGQKFDLGVPGQGASQAVAGKLCGADMFMMARVGEDVRSGDR
jgi:ribokinase